MTDKTLDVCQCHEKHAPTYWKGVVREYKDALEKAESRPLTPDAITDEMVERGRSAYWGPTYGGSVVGRVRAILAAALTEPPARPEGAEDIERLIRDAENEGQGADNEALANYLAARLTDPTRKEG